MKNVAKHKARPTIGVGLVVAFMVLVYACNTPTINSGTSGPSSSGTIFNGNNTASNPGGGLPTQANKPQPPLNTYQGCPSTGDGGDHDLNIRKNRTDSAPWYPVSIASILSLRWPSGIEQKLRRFWSPGDASQVAVYEGIPVQVEGWLAGAKQQGPESSNCHSVDDVDNHLWIVDSPGKDRAQSLVAEITPRMRAQNPGWAFERVRPLVDGKTKVRISGWLMMDQEHPDQVGKTRGTIWEIHPIIAFDVQRGNMWLSLNTGRVSTTGNAAGGDAVPTEDPNLPPTISDPYENTGVPTAAPLPTKGLGGGVAISSGSVEIDDIFFNGTKGSSEPDEYVEIANLGTDPVNMDGWVLHDTYGGQEFTWHGFTLEGQHRIRVYTNEVHAESGGFSFGSKGAIWANQGDAAELLDRNGNVVSTFAYGNKK